MKKENFACPIKEEEFMFTTFVGEDNYSEYNLDDNGKIVNNTIFDLIDVENKDSFGMIGNGIHIFYDKNGVFDILDKKFKLSLYDENNNDLFKMEEIAKVIAYKDARQFIKDGYLINETYGYNLGYKIENDKFFARIILKMNKYEGLSFSIEITGKEDDKFNFELEMDNNHYAGTELLIKKNEKRKINVNI